MSNQIPLFEPERTGPPRPDLSRKHPGVWVREFAIFKALQPGDEYVVRRIKLRLGLNVLWAKPEDSSKPARLHESGISGHASGKTTFCRMIRHLLGERHFATDVVTASIRAKFDGAWLAGDVVVDGEPWAVFRPFSVGAHRFAVQHCSIDDIIAGDPRRDSFDDYIAAVEQATAKLLPIQNFPLSSDLIEWKHLIEWLSRDQECRLITLTEWRSPLSKSEAPQVDTDDAHALMRATVGLLDEDERSELQNNARLVREKERSSAGLVLSRAQAAVDQDRLEKELNVKLPSLSDALFVNDVIARLEGTVTENKKLIRAATSDPEVRALRQKVEDAVRETQQAESRVRVAEASIAIQQKELDLHRTKAREQQASELQGALKPRRGFCAVPIDEARAKGCPLAHEVAIDFGSERALQAIEDDAPRLERQLQSLIEEKAAHEKGVTTARTNELAVRTQASERETKHGEHLDALYNQQTEAVNRLRLAQRAHEAFKTAQQLESDIVALEEAVKASHKKQEALRKHQAEAVRRISGLYEEIVRAVLGDGVTAGIRLGGRYLEPSIERNGDLSSGAIDTVKILAFDIASLAASVAGHGAHPRFLLHDSPREADMAPLTYQRFFLWARQLERMFPAGAECNFQYIVTTTEPPPEELRESPWLLEPVLDASEASKRLLGVDL